MLKLLFLEVACVTLRNTNKKNKRAKRERSVVHLLFLFLNYRQGLG